MTNTAPRAALITPSVIIAAVCGLLLLVSVFLPWLSPKSQIALSYSSASGLKVSSLIALTGIAGGLLAIGAAFIPIQGLKKFLHITIGLAAAGILAFVIFKGTLPLRSTIVMNYVSIGAGVFLYGLAALALLFAGLAEGSKAATASRQRASAPVQPVYSPPSAAVPPPAYTAPAWRPSPAQPP